MNEDITFLCPHCGQELAAPNEMAGERVDCPSCSQALIIPRSETESPSSPPCFDLPKTVEPHIAEVHEKSLPRTPTKLQVDAAKIQAMLKKTDAQPQKHRKHARIGIIAIGVAAIVLFAIMVSVITNRDRSEKRAEVRLPIPEAVRAEVRLPIPEAVVERGLPMRIKDLVAYTSQSLQDSLLPPLESDNEVEENLENRFHPSTLPSPTARQVDSDIRANSSLNHPLMKPDDKTMSRRTLRFNFDEYAQHENPNITSAQRGKLFDAAWKRAWISDNLPEYGRMSFGIVPDNIVYVVKDVSLLTMKNGKSAYKVKLEALLDCEKNPTLGTFWSDRPEQTREYLNMVRKTTGISRSVSLLIPEDDDDVADWNKGRIIQSNGWVSEWLLHDVILTYESGRKKHERKIYTNGFVFRSVEEAIKLEE